MAKWRRQLSPRQRRNKARCNIVIGLLILLGALISSGIQLKKQNKWVATTGTVIATQRCEGDNGDDNVSERAIIEYEVLSLETKYIFQSSLCSSNPPEVGGEIPVLYNPNKPSEAMDASFASAWLFQIIFGVGGLLLSFGSCFHLRSMNDDVDEPRGHNEQGESQQSFWNTTHHISPPTTAMAPNKVETERGTVENKVVATVLTSTEPEAVQTTLASMLAIDIPTASSDPTFTNDPEIHVPATPDSQPGVYVPGKSDWAR